MSADHPSRMAMDQILEQKLEGRIKMDLQGKIGIVTGAGTGMGRASALAMAQAGATVVLVGRRPEPLESVKAEIEAAGGTAHAHPADVLDRLAIKGAIEAAVSRFGRLDLAFNNAGGHNDFKPIDQTPEDEAEWVIDLNFKAVYWGVKYQVEQMLRTGGGIIVNNASIFGLKGSAGIAHYVASKHAVVGLTKAVSLEYAKQGIRVNAVCPGGTETPNFLRVTDGDAHIMDGVVPMGRIGRPSEVAEAVVWLMSERSAYVTGSTLSVDGGLIAG
ncbi:SDR family NAD(P)-dependent oxidoreductase [Novosphingobium arvoryzae]|uniref:Short chain dehydrogenase n=1 Tax=Novosphingobium arvoryzae TaxID=1256514 RepID=A0A918VJE2_9SPHN|nr:glucose 1-dehydrogenase [Novosphingobium arvoryzae]GHA02105.1 short chain dehydrogenase [Novosphingobium arvoryzae]